MVPTSVFEEMVRKLEAANNLIDLTGDPKFDETGSFCGPLVEQVKEIGASKQFILEARADPDESTRLFAVFHDCDTHFEAVQIIRETVGRWCRTPEGQKIVRLESLDYEREFTWDDLSEHCAQITFPGIRVLPLSCNYVFDVFRYDDLNGM